jgi:hypothetical protein
VLTTRQIVALNTTNIAALTTDQLAAFTTTQVMSFSSSQIGAIGSNITALPSLASPIVLDLNGDGVQTISYSAGVKFDLRAQGQAIQTGWVSSGDGLLVMDRNHDGIINNGAELFGSATTLANGTKATDGYQALRELDTDHDGVIDKNDAAFNDLGVWIDANSDGVSTPSEIHSLASLNITQISAQATAGTGIDAAGNLQGLMSSFQTADGATHGTADVWFMAPQKAASVTPSAAEQATVIDQAIAALGNTTVTASGPGALVTPIAAIQPNSVTVNEPATDLRSRVSSLAQALSTFGANGQSAGNGLAGEQQKPAGSSSNGTTLVASMLDVMQKFDSNGSLLKVPDKLAVAGAKSPLLSGVQDGVANGILAIGSK